MGGVLLGVDASERSGGDRLGGDAVEGVCGGIPRALPNHKRCHAEESDSCLVLSFALLCYHCVVLCLFSRGVCRFLFLQKTTRMVCCDFVVSSIELTSE